MSGTPPENPLASQSRLTRELIEAREIIDQLKHRIEALERRVGVLEHPAMFPAPGPSINCSIPDTANQHDKSLYERLYDKDIET